jgi:hypothetical protein
VCCSLDVKSKRENNNHGNQESSQEGASEEGSQEGRTQEEVSQRNRQHIRGTPKASPEVFWSCAKRVSNLDIAVWLRIGKAEVVQ